MTAGNALADHLPTLLSLSGESHLAENLGDLVRVRPPDSCIDSITALDALSHTRLMSGFNALLPAHTIAASPEGYMVFARESQDVVIWGYRFGDEEIDPIVYQSQPGTGDGPSAWYSEDLPLSSFLVSFAYWNLAQGAAIASGYGEASSATRSLIKELPKQ